MTGLSEDAPVAEVIQRLYELLAEAPSMILAATLEDLLQVAERPNMPGAPSQSWSLALPKTLDEFFSEPLARRIAAALGREESRERPAAPARASAQDESGDSS